MRNALPLADRERVPYEDQAFLASIPTTTVSAMFILSCDFLRDQPRLEVYFTLSWVQFCRLSVPRV
jgi:hypothetical protein